MNIIDKVIDGLTHCRLLCEDFRILPCNGCPYKGSYTCADVLKTDALELLKQQQKEIEERTNEAAAYAELLIKYGYEFTEMTL